jgi:hypothetical protein
MNRWEAIEIFDRLRQDAVVVHGHNFAPGELRDVHACTRWSRSPISMLCGFRT